MRLLQVTIGTAFVCFMLFISVRFWGEGQTFRPYESAFWHKNEATPLIVIPWEHSFFLEKIRIGFSGPTSIGMKKKTWLSVEVRSSWIS